MESLLQSDLIPTAEAAALLGYDPEKPSSITAFREFALREGIPHYRLSARRFRWSKSELEEWLRNRRVGGVSR